MLLATPIEEERVETIPTARFSCLELPRVKALASTGDETLVEDRRGQKVWMRTCDLVPRPGKRWCYVAPRRDLRPVDALAAAKLASLGTLGERPAAPSPRTCPLVSDGVWAFEGALSACQVAEIHSCAVSCLEEKWGTVRRRTVGDATDTMTHVRLTSQFAKRAPRALHTLERLVLSTGHPPLTVKQCDYLVYGPSDSAGWHDHAGESTLFLVALLFDDSCQGGEFMIREEGLSASREHKRSLLRRAGDVVLCRSHVEHRVSRILSGTRISINLDFWEPQKGSHDRRSLHDLI